MLVWQGVAMRIVISQVAEKKARCIAYFPINLTKLSQNRLGYTDIFLIILTGHPQAQDLRAVLLDDFLWRHDVAGRLRHLIAFAIEHEAVREHGLVRRAPVSGDAGQQRAVEPAAVLVGAFQVEIGRPPALPRRLAPRLEDRRVAHPGLEPHVQDVPLLVEVPAAALRAGCAWRQQFSSLPFEPDVGTVLLDQLGDMLDDRRRDEDLAASLARESRDRHAPHALAGEAPVRPFLDHAVDAIAAARREPSYYVDLLKCFLSEVILYHRDEPLIGGAEDHGILAPPAMRVGVHEGPLPEQDARRLELLHDQPVLLEDVLPLPFRGFVREPALIVHGCQDFQRRLDHCLIVRVVVLERQLVVFLPVSRRDVHAPRALIQGDELAEQDRRGALRRRAAAAQALEPAQLDPSLPDAQTAVTGKAAGLGHRIDQLLRNHQHLVPDPYERIVEVRMQADGLVGGQRPRRGRPDHDRDGLDVRWKVDAQDRAAGEHLGRVLQRKLDVDRRRSVLLVLDFGLGQGSLIDRAPEHRLLPLVHPATLYELADLAQDRGLVIVGHGQVRIVPVAQHAQALELLPLDLEVLLGVLAAEPADLDLAERLLLAAQFLQDLMLDRQPVAVPARHERHLVAFHSLGLDDDVLEDLVQRVADVDAAVGIRRAVVQHEEGPAAPGLLDPLIEAFALPAGQDLRLALREIGLHGKISLGEIQRSLVVHVLR